MISITVKTGDFLSGRTSMFYQANLRKEMAEQKN